jgi:hypothetical protein
MSKVELTVRPEGGWTPENTKAYTDEWWRQELARPKSAWEGIADPDGRLRRGQRIRWHHSSPGEGDMEVMYLCAPTGLYGRPIRDGDADWRVEHAALRGGLTSCEETEPGAVYQPERLMVCFRYLYSDSATTGQAIHMVVVADTVENGRALPLGGGETK